MTTDASFDAKIAEELKAKGISATVWAVAQKQRRLRIEGVPTHQPLICSCGLALYDLREYAVHRDNLSPTSRAEHKVSEA